MNKHDTKEQEGNEVDYKDIRTLRSLITPAGKIIPRRSAGTSAARQRSVSLAIKRARFLALLPYCDRHD